MKLRSGNNHLVSVIIKTYNRAQFLLEAINSVLAQTFPNIEIIVIDNGSTDNTKDVVGKFADKLSYFYIPHTTSPEARNEGIKLSRGDLISFLDADDIWLRSKIRRQVSFLDRNPEVAAVTVNYVIFDSKGQERFEKYTKRIYDELENNEGIINDAFTKLVRGSFMLSSTAMFRRNIIKQIGLFDYRASGASDLDFFLRLAKRTREVGFIKEILVKKRQHENNVSLNYSDNFKRIIYIFKKFYKMNDLSQRERKTIKRRIARMYINMSYDCYDDWNMKKARDMAFNSLYMGIILESMKVIVKSILPTPIVRLCLSMKGNSKSNPLRLIQDKLLLIVLDLDGTIAETMQPVSLKIVNEIVKILSSGINVAIISAQSLEEIKVNILNQILLNCKDKEAVLKNLFVFPCLSTTGYTFTGNNWRTKKLYDLFEDTFEDHRYLYAVEFVRSQAERYNLEFINREKLLAINNISFPLGQKLVGKINTFFVSRELKSIHARLDDRCINITAKGVDKSKALIFLLNHLALSTSDVIVLGDQFDSNGNDIPLVRKGIRAFSFGYGIRQDLRTHVLPYWKKGPRGSYEVLRAINFRIRRKLINKCLRNCYLGGKMSVFLTFGEKKRS